MERKYSQIHANKLMRITQNVSVPIYGVLSFLFFKRTDSVPLHVKKIESNELETMGKDSVLLKVLFHYM
jgi:hypothetical protein